MPESNTELRSTDTSSLRFPTRNPSPKTIRLINEAIESGFVGPFDDVESVLKSLYKED